MLQVHLVVQGAAAVRKVFKGEKMGNLPVAGCLVTSVRFRSLAQPTSVVFRIALLLGRLMSFTSMRCRDEWSAIA